MHLIAVTCLCLNLFYVLAQAVEQRSPPFIYKYYPQYCDIKDCPNQHTMCTYRPLVLRCQKPCKALMNKPLKKIILKNHNEGKQMVFDEGVSMKIRWNNDLEQMAHQWVGLCYNRTETCLRTRFNEEFGQIVNAWYEPSVGYNSTTVIDTYTRNIYVQNIDFFEQLQDDDLAKWDGKNKEKIQIIWAETRFIGCSFLEQPIGATIIARMVCNYYPPAKIGHTIFNRSLTECPYGSKRSERYGELCTDELDEYDDIPPPWYTRVRVYNGKIIYPDAPDAAALSKISSIVCHSVTIIVITLF